MWQYNSFYDNSDNVLCHHGIQGQKWGVRRFQNEDGSLTPAGKKRYGNDKSSDKKEEKRKAVKDYIKQYNKAESLLDKSEEEWSNVNNMYKNLGKSKLSRIREVTKAQKGNGSKAANEYLRAWNEAEKHENNADREYKKAKEMYKKLGKTYLSRIISVTKYDNESWNEKPSKNNSWDERPTKNNKYNI